MGRRKTVDVVQLQSGGSYQGRSSDNLCTREFLEKKYDAAVSEIRPTTLYEDTTTYHINRIEGLFREYCSILRLDPLQTLSECATARIENFLHWLLKTYTIKKTSTMTTYWRQLSQVYILWTQRRVDPNILKQIFMFIESPLIEEYHLDNIETEKPLLEADDFVEFIQYHWVSDINIFPNERRRVQLAAILLLAAFTGSRPHALLSLTYSDLDLYVDRNSKTGAHVLKLGVQLTKTKSRQKRKRPKTYTFNLDDNPLFCIISHIINLAFDDEAFGIPDLTSPDQLFRLRAKRSNGCQPIPWKTEMLDTPIFRRVVATSMVHIYDMVRTLRERDNHIRITWIPARGEFGLGKKAKEAARRATEQGFLSRGQLYRTKSTTIKIARAKQREHRALPEEVGRYSREIDTALLGKHTRTLYDAFKRREARILAQLRTGMARLNGYLHRIGAAESDQCAYGQAKETIKHFLFRCTMWATHRTQMLQQTDTRRGSLSFYLGGKAPSDSEPWTPNMDAVRATVKYAIATGRLETETEHNPS